LNDAEFPISVTVEPILIEISPALPPVAAPVENKTFPAVPELVVPEVNSSCPLLPFTPAFDVVKTIDPVLVNVPSPVESDTDPPV
jgi:hypothetical protein